MATALYHRQLSTSNSYLWEEYGNVCGVQPADVIASDIVAFGKDGFLLAAIPNGQAWAVEQPKNLVFRTDGTLR